MSPETERYLLLGLHVGRHVDGIVDAYFGPPELAAAANAVPPVDPRTLVREADALLDAVEDGWLRDQLGGLRTYAGVLAGESHSYVDEVEGCYGVRPSYTDEREFTAAHERLEELLPGDGALAERYERWRTTTRVPPEQLERTLAAVIEEARVWTRRVVELPQGENVSLEIVHDEPWLGFCEYLGELRSRIAVNADLPTSGIELLHLAMHETYPGHHAERCCKEHALVHGRGLLEEAIVLLPTPQSLVSEGIAEIGPRLLLESDGGDAVAGALRGADVELDLAHALAVQRAVEPFDWASVNAALMLHDDGATVAEAQEYVERWALMTSQLAAHVVRFMREPSSRTYVMNYAAGRDLCRAYVAGDLDRFAGLLTEQVRVRDLLKSADGRR